MFHWEPEGHYCHRHCTVIAPFWFSMEHLFKNSIYTLLSLKWWHWKLEKHSSHCLCKLMCRSSPFKSPTPTQQDKRGRNVHAAAHASCGRTHMKNTILTLEADQIWSNWHFIFLLGDFMFMVIWQEQSIHCSGLSTFSVFWERDENIQMYLEKQNSVTDTSNNKKTEILCMYMQVSCKFLSSHLHI